MKISEIIGKTKLEQLGLSEKAIELKRKGLGSIRIAKVLSHLGDNNINSANVDNFFKNLDKTLQQSKVLTKKLDNEVVVGQLKVLGDWGKIDGQLKNLLEEASALQTRVMTSKAGPIEVKYKDLRLWKDVLVDISRITETRARLLGQMSQGVHITITNIENQYNDLKALVIDAEEAFPGIGEWIEKKMYRGKKDDGGLRFD